MERDTRGSGRLLLAAALVLATYASGVWAIGIARSSELTAAWWPAAGFGVMAALVVERRHWRALFPALGLAYTLANLTGGQSVGTSLLLGGADLVETVIVAALLLRLVGPRLRDLQDIWWLFAIASAGAVVAALGIALTVWLMLDGDFWRTLAITAPSHAASVMLMAPLALIGWGRLHARPVELTAQVLALTATTLITFGPGTQLTVAFAPLPLLVWAAARFDIRVIALEQVLFAATVSWFTRLGWGPFNEVTSTVTNASSILLAQLYLICLILIGLPLAVAMNQRERAVSRLRSSERVFRRNFTESRVPVVLVQLDQGVATFADCNEATARVLRRTTGELVGRPVAAFLVSDELQRAFDDVATGVTADWGGHISVVGRPRTRLDGTLSMLEQDEDRVFFSLHMVDVTEPLELQERLQAERDYTRAVIDTASSMIVVTDVHGTIIAANPATTALTGFTEDELVGHPFWEQLVAEHQREPAAALFGDAQELPRTGEAQLQTRDGQLRMVVFSADIYRANPDAPMTCVISATDVTAARENAGMVEHLLRSARTIAFVGTDLEGSITLFNTGAEHMLGIAADEATGRELVEFISPDDLERYPREPAQGAFQAIVGHAAGELTPETRDWTWLPAGRAPMKVSMTTNPVTDTFGHVIGYLFVASDITDTRRSQEILVKALRREREVVARLKDLDRAKDDFVSTVSHELRTPMSSIIGSAEMLGEGVLGELLPEQQRMVNVISRNGDRLLALADDLLVLATFDHDSLQDLDSRLDLRAVVQESAHAIASMLATRTLDVAYDVPDEPVLVIGDGTHLERAVTNLLTNAVKFTPDGGSVRVALEVDLARRSALLSVADTGLGIPEADLEAVFGRFYRTAVVQQHAIQGSGLGLAIVKTIVESHEGRVDVRSAPGEGTTFTISLPLARAAARTADEGVTRSASGR